MKVKVLKILRGLPAAGKSTLASEIVFSPDLGKTKISPIICSADHFFMKDGVYRRDNTQLQAAHNACLLKFLSAVKDNNPLVVIDNSSITIDEIAPYWRVGVACDYRVEIITLFCTLELALKRNAAREGDKRVPAHVIGRMDVLLPLHTTLMPKHWRHTVLSPTAP